MATSNPVRRSEAGSVMRRRACLVWLLVTASCISSTAAPSATALQPIAQPDDGSQPSARSPTVTLHQSAAGDAGPTVWRFAGTLLLPSDPNSYANVILDVEPLKDSGWVVVRDRAPNRRLPSGGPSRGPFIPAHGSVMRLDAAGGGGARQSAASECTPTHLDLFQCLRHLG